MEIELEVVIKQGGAEVSWQQGQNPDTTGPAASRGSRTFDPSVKPELWKMSKWFLDGNAPWLLAEADAYLPYGEPPQCKPERFPQIKI